MNSNKIGKQGEQLFAQIMREKGYEVTDVSNNPDYYNKDIDFIIKSPFSGKVKTFEVKFDTRINQTNNLYLETKNIHSKQWNGEGWFKHTEADFIAYGDAHSRTFYIFPLLELKEKVNKLHKNYGQCGKDSIGLLIQLKDVEDIYSIL